MGGGEITSGMWYTYYYIIGFVQDCGNSSVLAMDLAQSRVKPSIYRLFATTWLSYWTQVISYGIINIGQR